MGYFKLIDKLYIDGKKYRFKSNYIFKNLKVFYIQNDVKFKNILPINENIKLDDINEMIIMDDIVIFDLIK